MKQPDYDARPTMPPLDVPKLHRTYPDFMSLPQKRPRQPQLIVADHAVLRFIQRGMGVDVDQIRRMLFEKVAKPYATVGDAEYPIGNGLTAVVEKGTLRTVFRRGE